MAIKAQRSPHEQNVRRVREVADKDGFTFSEEMSVLGVEQLRLIDYKVKNNIIQPDPERVRSLRELVKSISHLAQERIVGYFSCYSKWIRNYSEKILKLNQNTSFHTSRRN